MILISAPIDLETKAVNAFKRVESSGTFTVLNYSPEATANDSIPPARITTLQVVYSEGSHFNISWDAVGDDIAYGNGTCVFIIFKEVYDSGGTVINVYCKMYLSNAHLYSNYL